MSEFVMAEPGSAAEARAQTAAESGGVPKLSPVRKWSMLVVLSLALAIIILDTTILNVALSAIIQDLKTDIQSLQWVITAYSLTLAALTITGGRLGDIFGRKKMFICGAILFGVGSFLASISDGVPMLIIGESLIEGMGAALMMPATASLLVANFAGRERAIAFGVWGGIAGASAALGPILGGYFATNYSWRWGFRINLIVIALLLIGSLLIPESSDKKDRPKLDLAGVFLSSLGMLSLVFGIIEASRYGWWHVKETFTFSKWTVVPPFELSVVPFFILIGLVILAIFIAWELIRENAGRTPLVSMRLFKNRQFSVGVLTVGVLSLGQTGLIFALPVFLQAVRGLNALQTGVALLPMSLGLLIVSPLSAVLGKKISPKFLIALGLLLNVAAYIVLYYSLGINATRTDLIPGLALFGIGMGLVMSQINNLTLSAVPVEQAGEASGINNTLRQVGSTLGSAIIGTILVGTLGTHLVQGVRESAVIPAENKEAIAQQITAQASNVEFGGGAQLSSDIPAALRPEIVRIGHQATTDANRVSLLYGAIFAAFGFLVSLFLPRKKREPVPAVADSAPGEAPVRTVVARAEIPPKVLDTSMVAELIHLDERMRARGSRGVGSDVRMLIDVVGAGESLSTHVDPRLLQAQILWERGVGRALGFADMAAYLQTIPPVPASLRTENGQYPYLVLVDPRLSPLVLTELFGILPLEGQEMAHALAADVAGEAYWIRCQGGTPYLGQRVDLVEASLAGGETGLSILEGLCFVAQYPTIIDLHCLDLSRSAVGSQKTIACIGTWDGQKELRTRWRDYPDQRFGLATKIG